MGWTIGIALAFFTAIFIVLPAVAANGLGNFLGLDGFWFHVAEGALRLGIFLGYLLLDRAAEGHQARVPCTTAPSTRRSPRTRTTSSSPPESAQRFDTSHVRCGTNFLLTVMVITIFVYSFVGRPGWALLILSPASCCMPVIAG